MTLNRQSLKLFVTAHLHEENHVLIVLAVEMELWHFHWGPQQ